MSGMAGPPPPPPPFTGSLRNNTLKLAVYSVSFLADVKWLVADAKTSHLNQFFYRGLSEPRHHTSHRSYYHKKCGILTEEKAMKVCEASCKAQETFADY